MLRRQTALLGGLLVCAFCTPGPTAAPDSRAHEILAGLPLIDRGEQCHDITCDYTVESLVFETVDSIAGVLLRRGMRLDSVRRLIGPPTDRYEPPWAFADTTWHNRVVIWTWAHSLSGTEVYVMVFVNGCVDWFGRTMLGYVLGRYGRPGSTSGGGEGYRFTAPDEQVCKPSKR